MQGFDARFGAFLEKDRRAPVAQDRIVTAWEFSSRVLLLRRVSWITPQT
jgi:hypothetical protein